ncbi:MAG: hypothetical protein RID09_23150 [Coleofasciculus sp. G1-WW12-02]|uniref:hypothetical protein n=1 Tax=Coleofasciculus sp. G1-WW12-02 TaxID=3068483 RepID=UPI00330478DF
MSYRVFHILPSWQASTPDLENCDRATALIECNLDVPYPNLQGCASLIIENVFGFSVCA